MLGLDKFFDFMKAAMGYGLEPRHQKHLADSKAHEIDVLSSAIEAARNRGVDAAIVDGRVAARNIEGQTLSLDERTQIRLEAETKREQTNFEEIASYTYEELKNVDSVSDETVDPDWATAFVNSAKMISNEKMQILFGKILAGEINRPGTFGMRTIEVLRNMSQKEAEIFQKMASLVVSFHGNLVIPRVESQLYHEFDVNDEIFIVLGEMGILSENHNLELNWVCGPGKPIKMRYGDTFIASVVESEIQIRPPIYRITNVGMELYGLRKPVIHPNYVETVIARWGRMMRIPLIAGKIIKTDGQKLILDEMKPLT